MLNKITLLILALIFILTSCGGGEDESAIETDVETTAEIEIEFENANPKTDFEYVIEPEQIIIKKYIGEAYDVVIPKKIDDKKVTDIGSIFRGNTKITSVVIPDTVTSITKYAFQKCVSLGSVNIPSGVTVISEAAFYGCGSLTEIVLPESVTEIGELAFRDCFSLADINIPESVTKIGYGAFTGCNLLPETVKNKISQINPDAIDN